MSLIDLLRNPDTFNIGINNGSGISPNRNLSYGGPSKSIKYGSRSGETKAPSYHLVDRVEWDYSDKNANPTFTYGGKKSHFDDPFPDFMFRGSLGTYKDRLRIDIKRITNFLFGSHGRGAQFILRQGALQFLNPQINEKIYNLGVNTLLQVATSGLMRFKRGGLLPEPVGSPAAGDMISDLTGQLGANAPDVLGNLLGSGGYLTLKGSKIRGSQGNRYNLGDPGRKTPPDFLSMENFFGGNPLEDASNLPYNIAIPEHKKDKLTLSKVFDLKPGELANDLKDIDDFCPFRFQIINSNNVLYSKVIAFRAYITNFSDSYNASHNNIKLNGRGETFYTYNGFIRSISLNFKIAALSRDEMKPLYQKLNYLAAQTAPNYSKLGRIRTPYMRVTVGDYFKEVVGILNSVNISWTSEYPWEIKLDPKELDKDMKILPQVLDVSVTFTPIHDFVPTNEIDTPFIGLNPGSSKDADWLPENIDPTTQSQPKQETDGSKSVSYVVQPGDTLSGIASKFGIANWQDIADANGITDPKSLQAGATITIPSNNANSTPPPGAPPPPPPND